MREPTIRVLILSHSNIHRDPRLVRQIRWLNELGAKHITTVGWGPKPAGVSRHYPVPVLPLLKRYFGYMIRRHTARFNFFFGRFLDRVPPGELSNLDLLVVNEIEYIPWLMESQSGLSAVPTYLDLHEDHINNADRGLLEKFAFRKYWTWQVQKAAEFVKKSQSQIAITSVEDVIASSYSKLFSEPVQLIYNSPDSNNLKPTLVKEDSVRLVHHGMGTKGRGIEETIRALKLLDARFTLDLILFATPQFRLKIEILSRLLGVRSRIDIRAGVPLDELPTLLNHCDISIILISGVIPGHLNTLPNKLFESIHSKLAVITGPNPSMSNIVANSEIGVSLASWSFKDLATSLSNLNAEDIQTFKRNADLASPHFSSVQSKQVFAEIVRRLGVTGGEQA